MNDPRWIANVKPTKQVDVYDPSFPWSKGKPDWDLFRAVKTEERIERNRGKKQKIGSLTDRCMYFVDKPCRAKAFGMAQLSHEGRDVLVPLCQEHKALFVKDK
jgi:hypothetical protein